MRDAGEGWLCRPSILLHKFRPGVLPGQLPSPDPNSVVVAHPSHAPAGGGLHAVLAALHPFAHVVQLNGGATQLFDELQINLGAQLVVSVGPVHVLKHASLPVSHA